MKNAGVADKFHIFILKNTENTAITKTKEQKKDECSRLSQFILSNWVNTIQDSLAMWPDWYISYVDGSDTERRGEAIVSELENLIVIIDHYIVCLKGQTVHNKEACIREYSHKSDKKSSLFHIRKGMPQVSCYCLLLHQRCLAYYHYEFSI